MKLLDSVLAWLKAPAYPAKLEWHPPCGFCGREYGHDESVVHEFAKPPAYLFEEGNEERLDLWLRRHDREVDRMIEKAERRAGYR